MRFKKEAVATLPIQTTPGPGIKKSLQIPGLFDILTETQTHQDVILKRFLEQAKIYGFKRLETPPLEDIQLYKLYYGANSRVIDSLAQVDVGGRILAMRPDLLPSVLRAYAQHKVYELQPASKWMYSGTTIKLGPKSQLITDYNLGVEVFGNFTHLSEAQTIASVWYMFQSLGLNQLTLEINHIGTANCQKNLRRRITKLPRW